MYNYTANGACQDGGPGSVSSICTFGTDCTDCGRRYMDPPSPPSAPTAWWLELECPAGTAHLPEASLAALQIASSAAAQDAALTESGVTFPPYCKLCEAGTASVIVNAGGLRECRACTIGKVQPFRGRSDCLTCPDNGVSCVERDRMYVRPGYYLPLANHSRTASSLSNVSSFSEYSGLGGRHVLEPWVCPQRKACMHAIADGSTANYARPWPQVAGDASCAPGHHGPLCGGCDVGYYRGRNKCSLCPNAAESAAAASKSIAGLVVLGLIVIIALGTSIYYLHSAVAQRGLLWTQSKRRFARRLSRFVLRMVTLIPARKAATLCKSLISYGQILMIFPRFLRVAWPQVFRDFVSLFECVSARARALNCRCPCRCPCAHIFDVRLLPLESAACSRLMSSTSSRRSAP